MPAQPGGRRRTAQGTGGAFRAAGSSRCSARGEIYIGSISMRNAPNMPARGLQILDCQEGGSGGVAYAAWVDAVADGHDVLEPGF